MFFWTSKTSTDYNMRLWREFRKCEPFSQVRIRLQVWRNIRFGPGVRERACSYFDGDSPMSQHEQNDEGRRRFLKVAAGTVAAAVVVGIVPGMARAADIPHLSPTDPTAAALKYVEDASKAADPKHKAGDTCANCQFFQGKASDAYAPCQLFPGKAVASKGWCVSHAVKA
jgi:hypothetical protein